MKEGRIGALGAVSGGEPAAILVFFDGRLAAPAQAGLGQPSPPNLAIAPGYERGLDPPHA